MVGGSIASIRKAVTPAGGRAFEEGWCIAWRPAVPGLEPPGHLWRWELEPLGPARTRVVHTYDWTQLPDESERIVRARATTADRLQWSVDRLADLVESGAARPTG